MEFKQLAETGVNLSEIGLGTGRYTAGVEPIRKAVELGAALVDTAELYGTEAIVGRAVHDIRNKVFISTKVSPEHFRKNDLRNSVEASLKALNTDYIDLYQLHRPNPRVPIDETMGSMEDIVDAGKVRFIGVSNFSVERLREAQAAMTKHKIVSNQVSYSLLDRRIESGLLDYCRANNITVIAYSPMAEGLNNIRSKDRGGVIEKLADETGKSAAQIVLNWCVRHENVVAIPKASTIAHVEDNCGASSWRLTAQQVSMLEDGVKGYGMTDYVSLAMRDVIYAVRSKARAFLRR